jgi:hypothetical protein
MQRASNPELLKAYGVGFELASKLRNCLSRTRWRQEDCSWTRQIFDHGSVTAPWLLMGASDPSFTKP